MKATVSVFKGDAFQWIAVYPDRIECRSSDTNTVLTSADTGCIAYLNGEPCQQKDCRHYIPFPDFNNCSLGAYRRLTLEEIGDIFGVTREQIRQDEERALLKSRKILKRINHRPVGLCVADFIKTEPEWNIRRRRRERAKLQPSVS